MKWNKIIGTLILLFNLRLIWMEAKVFYQFHYSDLRFFNKSPDWMLFSFIFIGILGTIVGAKVFSDQWSIKKGLLLGALLIAIAFLIGQLAQL
ncbi:hypothetical protein [Flagellimonas flava]|uniref:hypothetical protein n=1 Tax=Flagellimonas flava TaxID=570519 RepID=UPI003D64B99F